MCGIAGIIKYKENVNVGDLKLMIDSMVLRGPDDEGLFIEDHVALGHRRLAIIDVKSGKQPMSTDDGNYVIVYNGETYNFQEVRTKLEDSDVLFSTDSDTEVILKAYRLWGIERCLAEMDGMWALAIYDKQKQKVFIARDRFGEKPLYYQSDDNGIVFASELKAFSPSSEKYKVDKKALNLFLSLSYIPAPYTIYDGINKMKAGHYLEIDLVKGNFEDHQYYDVIKEKNDVVIDEDIAVKKIQYLLKDSVKKRMVSDVPIGAFLSGGVDSSIVCCLMSQLSDKPINTFSIGFKERDYDESERAEIVVNHIKSNHTKFVLDYADVLEILDDIVLYYDEPYGDSSAIPSFYVAKLAKEKVSVVLTGDCADELFGGYDKYTTDYYVRQYNKLPRLARNIIEWFVHICPVTSHTNILLRKIKKVIRNSNSSGFDMYYNMMCLGFSDESRKELLLDSVYDDIKPIYKEIWDGIPSNYSDLLKNQLMDVKGVLEGDMFPKMDRACMHVSLENRAPFIDKRLLHLAMNLDDRLKVKGKNKKILLKKAFKGVLPPETIKFSKSGFGVPIDYWFRKELKEELLDLLNKKRIEEQGLFNYNYVKKVINEHLERKENNRFLLWNLFVFQKWYYKIYKAKN